MRSFGAKLLSNARWILAESEVDRVIQEIVDARVAQRVLNQKRLARLPRPEEKMRLFLQEGGQIQHAFDHRTAFSLGIIRRHDRQIS